MILFDNCIEEKMKWLKNITEIIDNRSAGICPYCKSKNTDYRIVRVNESMGYLDVWCNDCKRAYHISRMEVSPDIIIEKVLPDDLIY